MRDKDSSKSGSSGKKGKKIFLLALAAVFIFVVLIFLLIPVYISSEAGRKRILGRINSAITGKASIGDISMGWWKGVLVRDFHIDHSADDTSFSFDAKQISTKPYYGAILSGTLSFGRTIIDQPQIMIKMKQQKPQVHSKQSYDVTVDESAALALGLIDLQVNKGNAQINLESLDKTVKTLHLKDIQTSLALEPPGRTSTFDVSMAVGDSAKASSVSVKGNLKPSTEESWTLKGTSGDFTIKIDDLDIGSISPLLALAGQDVQPQGKLNADVEVNIDDGNFRKLKADAVLSDLKQVVSGKEVAIGEAVKVTANIFSDDKTVNIDKLNIESSFCRLNCKGKADKIEYDLIADLKQTQDFAGQFTDFGTQKIAGKLTAAGKISIDKNMINAAGQSTIKSLVVSSDSAAAPSTDVKIDFDTQMDSNKEILKIRTAKVSALPGEINITDARIPLAQGIKEQLRADIAANIDLARVVPYAVAFDSFPKDMQLSGQAESKISLNAEKDSCKCPGKF
ncbi:MAG: hypothetical protein ACYTBV_05850 [Planctomycetota bacterium]|jgi:hypothetical protein